MRRAYAPEGAVIVSPSEDLLRRLARVRPLPAFLTALVLLLAGLFLPGIVGAAMLFLLGAVLVALTWTTWPVQSPATRALRVTMLVALFIAAAAKAL
jgi:hypothetical protein